MLEDGGPLEDVQHYDGKSVRINRIEIPMIQRDYAQGRKAAGTDRIRHDFLQSLREVLEPGSTETLELDFIWGDIGESGELSPLDGQQRLTTLFLLHWYVASRAGMLDTDDAAPAWTAFSYATRPAARQFCERLGEHPWPEDRTPATWITEQAWYGYLWKYDPTIKGMLVMLDAMHRALGDLDATAMWTRLTDEAAPAIVFQLLPVDLSREDAESLYITMNARGKPLTDFEVFKARFEDLIKDLDGADTFAQRIDGAWTDMVWTLGARKADVDRYLWRYISYVVDLCTWLGGDQIDEDADLLDRARRVLGVGAADRQTNLTFLTQAFDVWAKGDSGEYFGRLFRRPDDEDTTADRMALFVRSTADLDLFARCCLAYGVSRTGEEGFSMGDAVLLLACIRDRSVEGGLPNFSNSLRTIRNVLEDSEPRVRNMPAIVMAFQRYLAGGSLDGNGVLSEGQIGYEERKTSWLRDHPDMRHAVHQLEDHPLLRGNLAGFDLDADHLPARADAFRTIMEASDQWLDLTGAILTAGDYQRPRNDGGSFRFGSPNPRIESPWREVFTMGKTEQMGQRRDTFNRFLDRIAAGSAPLTETYAEMIAEFLSDREYHRQFDWRYYMVKYPQMRWIDGKGGGLYFTNREIQAPMGYVLALMRDRITSVNSLYRDPYLFAIVDRLPRPLRDKLSDRAWYTGYETGERWLGAMDDGIAFRCADEGFVVRASSDPNGAAAYRAIRETFKLDEQGLLRIPQAEVNDAMVDTEDRILVGARLLEAIVASGF